MSRITFSMFIGVVMAPVVLAGGQIVFEDVTLRSGIVFEYDRDGSTTVGDYDGDGWLDVLITGSDVSGIQLFRNNGDKTFTNVTATVLPADAPQAHMGLFADMDDDGDVDLLLGARFGPDDSALDLLINNGGVFVRSTFDFSFTRHLSRIGGIPVADMDGDGDLDIVLTHKPGPNFYIRNDLSSEGVLSFVDQTTEFGARLKVSGRTMCTVLLDMNGDMQPDVYGAVDFGLNYYALSSADDPYTYVYTGEATGNGSDMGVAIGDIENDGDMDLYITNIGFHVLYVNDGFGNLIDRAQNRGVRFTGEFGVGWGTMFGDLDHDLDLDLALLTTGQPWGALFENDGRGHFEMVTDGSNLDTQGRGLVLFDYDRDGDLDLLKGDTRGNPTLYENVTPSLADRHWLIVELDGTISNSAGLGARIQATVGDVTMTRQMVSADSFLTGTPHYVHFGLGTADRVDTVRVQWPSGAVQTLRNVASDQYLSITEERCQGDVFVDNRVDLSDLALFLSSFGRCSGDEFFVETADIDGDGCADLSDLRTLLEGFARICP